MRTNLVHNNLLSDVCFLTHKMTKEEEMVSNSPLC